jgi:hypothetical protein
MKTSEYRDAVVAWALECLQEGARERARAGVDKRGAKQPIADVAARFGLDATARQIVELLWAAERSLAVARQARAVAGEGARGVTVEVIRELFDGDALLAPDAPLRRHALVTVAGGASASAVDELRLGAGLAARLDGAPAPVEKLCAGMRLVDAKQGERWAPSARVTELVKEELFGSDARIITVAGCALRDALGLAVALSRRANRTVLAVDGAIVAAQPSPWALVAAARRDADLDGHALLIYQAASLGGHWAAAAAAPPAAPLRPVLVVLADGEHVPSTAAIDGLRDLALTLAPPASATPVAAAIEAPPKVKEDDGYDHIRAIAMRDAERALGVYRPTPPPTAPAPAPAPIPAAAPVPAAAPAAAAAPPTDAPKPRKRSRKAIEHFGPGPDDAAAPPPDVAAATAAPPDASAATTAAASPPVDSGPPPPYVEIPENASIDLIARIAQSCPNPQQRIALIQQVSTHKSSSVVASLRHNAKSEHPGVRAAAEAAMTTLFGPGWNRPAPPAKAIVQPPRSDDDRGPPGG